MGVTAKVTLTEKEGNLGPCRLSMPAEVTVGNPLNRKGKVCSLPARDTAKVLEKLNGIFEYAANQNVFEAAMNTGNHHTFRTSDRQDGRCVLTVQIRFYTFCYEVR